MMTSPTPTTPTTLPLKYLDRNGVVDLIHAFYADVRSDPLLGPIFGEVIQDDWEPHLARMVEFWSTIMLGSRSFKGNVYGKHVELGQRLPVRPEHFFRWLTLWNKHTSGRFVRDIAQDMQTTAQGIGRNLFYGFFGEFALFRQEDGVVVGYEADLSARPPAR